MRGNPKPEPRQRVKRRRQRGEKQVEKSVRAKTVERDGHCLVYTRIPAHIAVLLGPCEGDSEWAHIGKYRRCFTRGLLPEQRHTTVGSGQLCHKHHADYDAHRFDFETDEEHGMDGTIGIKRRAA